MVISSKDQRAFQLGLKLLKLSTHSRYRLVAIIMKSGRVISVGVNREDAAPKGYTKETRENLHLHAEIAACHGLSRKETKNSTMYVIGKTKFNNWLLSKPCYLCYNWIKNMEIRRIVFNDRQGELHEV